MELKITSSVDTNTGIQVSNSINTIDVNSSSLESTGIAGIYLKSWYSEETRLAGKGNIYIQVDGNAIDNFNIQLTEQEILAANLPLTIYTKVKDYLAATYDFTVEIIQ